MKLPNKGDIVKFIGNDGRTAFTRITGFQPRNFETCAVLEIASGFHNGKAALVPLTRIVWTGKQFIADMREAKEV